MAAHRRDQRVYGAAGSGRVRKPPAGQSAFYLAKIDEIPKSTGFRRRRLLRHPGRHRVGADPARRRGVDQQPPLPTASSTTCVGSALVGAAGQGGRRPVDDPQRGLTPSAAQAATLPRVGRRCISRNGTNRRPPASAGASELIAIAGGDDVFPSARPRRWRGAVSRRPGRGGSGARRSHPGSWCGKEIPPGKMLARPGWPGSPPPSATALHEVKPPIILQPARRR